MAAEAQSARRERARRVGLTLDAARIWENMCYKNGPLLNPRMVRRYMMPHYRHFLERAEAVFGRGENVRPTWRPVQAGTDRDVRA